MAHTNTLHTIPCNQHSFSNKYAIKAHLDIQTDKRSNFISVRIERRRCGRHTSSLVLFNITHRLRHKSHENIDAECYFGKCHLPTFKYKEILFYLNMNQYSCAGSVSSLCRHWQRRGLASVGFPNGFVRYLWSLNCALKCKLGFEAC